MKRKINKYLYWAPRILSIFFICFLALFSLDVFSPELNFWQILIGLLIHNIPVFILLVVLLISWKHEMVGGIVFTLAGLLYILMLAMSSKFEWYMLSWSATIAGPAFLVGILFIINWFNKKKRTPINVKKILIFLLLMITTLLLVRFLLGGNEDNWICENNQWIKHGNPSAPMPQAKCN